MRRRPRSEANHKESIMSSMLNRGRWKRCCTAWKSTLRAALSTTIGRFDEHRQAGPLATDIEPDALGPGTLYLAPTWPSGKSNASICSSGSLHARAGGRRDRPSARQRAHPLADRGPRGAPGSIIAPMKQHRRALHLCTTTRIAAATRGCSTSTTTATCASTRRASSCGR